MDVLYAVLLTYNNKMEHTVTKMTPKDVMESKGNQIQAKLNMELRRLNTRNYEKIEGGSRVRLFKKKKQFEKGKGSNWSDKIYTGEEIQESLGQTFYKLSDVPRVVVRADIRLVW